jgi:hypothetical protein
MAVPPWAVELELELVAGDGHLAAGGNGKKKCGTAEHGAGRPSCCSPADGSHCASSERT